MACSRRLSFPSNSKVVGLDSWALDSAASCWDSAGVSRIPTGAERDNREVSCTIGSFLPVRFTHPCQLHPKNNQGRMVPGGGGGQIVQPPKG